MTSEELEQLRRSLVMAPGEGPATMLSNSVAASLINELLNLRRHSPTTTTDPTADTQTANSQTTRT